MTSALNIIQECHGGMDKSIFVWNVFIGWSSYRF